MVEISGVSSPLCNINGLIVCLQISRSLFTERWSMLVLSWRQGHFNALAEACQPLVQLCDHMWTLGPLTCQWLSSALQRCTERFPVPVFKDAKPYLRKYQVQLFGNSPIKLIIGACESLLLFLILSDFSKPLTFHIYM